MPSTSKKQHNFMEMVAHDPKAAKRVGVPQSVGKDFAMADTGKSFAKGGDVRVASYAAGGPVLGRTRDFLKEPVEFREADEGERKNADVVGDTADEDQKYGKSGAGRGKGCVPPPPARGKQLKAVVPRK